MAEEKSSLSNNRIAYILLALFFGSLGIHNFYVGRIKQGLLQLILTALGLFTFGITSLIAWIWALIDAVTVKANGSGEPMHL